jgi:hypothetical protein
LSVPPVLYVGLTFSLASLAFSFGSWVHQRQMSQQLPRTTLRLTALRDEMARSILEMRASRLVPLPSGTRAGQADVVRPPGRRGALVDEVKRQLQSEMGCSRFACCVTARKASSS